MAQNVKELLKGKGLLAELEACRNKEETIKALKREKLWGGSINYPELEELKESYKNSEIEADGILNLSQLDKVAGGGKGKQFKIKRPTGIRVSETVKLLEDRKWKFELAENVVGCVYRQEANKVNEANLEEFEKNQAFEIVTNKIAQEPNSKIEIDECLEQPQSPPVSPEALIEHMANKEVEDNCCEPPLNKRMKLDDNTNENLGDSNDIVPNSPAYFMPIVKDDLNDWKNNIF